MKPHKHAEIIKAWADGAKIEQKFYGDYWDYCDNPTWSSSIEYRIKPETKNEIVLYAKVTYMGNGQYNEKTEEFIDDLEISSSDEPIGNDNLILVFDAETKELIFTRLYE